MQADCDGLGMSGSAAVPSRKGLRSPLGVKEIVAGLLVGDDRHGLKSKDRESYKRGLVGLYTKRCQEARLWDK